MVKPNFFLIGAPKCGTTAVAKALAAHPEIFISEPKEPEYFVYARGNPYGFDPKSNISNLADYMALFDGVRDKKVVGEASPLYMYAPYIASEIIAFNPDAKIMVILSNPVERAYSHYLFWYQYEKRAPVSPNDFREKFFTGAFNSKIVLGDGDYIPMEFVRSFGFYHRLLQPYFATFPRERILVLSYDDLKANPAYFLKRVLKFLQVDDNWQTELVLENVTIEPKSRLLYYWLNLDNRSGTRQQLKRLFGSSEMAKSIRAMINRINQRKVPATEFLSDGLFRELIEVYRDDITNLSRMVGTDFTPWLRGAPSVPPPSP